MKKRLFLALPLAPKFVVKLKPVLKNLEKVGLKTTRLENLHVTILFLGYVDEEKIAEVEKRTDNIASQTHCFELKFEKIILAPPLKTKTMVWATFKQNQFFENLAKKAAENLAEFSSKKPREKRIPHITLARFKEKFEIKLNLKPTDLFEIKAEKLVLCQSKPHPTGSIYIKMKDFQFKN